MIQIKFCSRCGNSIVDNIKFCEKCGFKIINNNQNNNNKINHKENNIDKKDNASKEVNVSEDVSINRQLNLNKEMASEQIVENENILEDEGNKKSYKKKKIIVASIIGLIIIFICSVAIFSKDDILYNYYYNKGNKEIAVSSKIKAFNKALKYDNNQQIIQDIFRILKNDSYFIEELDKLFNLKKEDKAELIKKIFIFKTDEALNKEYYTQYIEYVELGKTYNVGIDNYHDYDEVMKKVKEVQSDEEGEKIKDIYTFENKNPTELGNDIYNYPYDYISNSSNRENLSESYLSKYNKETLALIRNEIFARHGYDFKEEPFKTYFNSKSWYEPNYSFKGDLSELNEYEIKNINLIKKLEENR